jgi:hypothetical protein
LPSIVKLCVENILQKIARIAQDFFEKHFPIYKNNQIKIAEYCFERLMSELFSENQKPLNSLIAFLNVVIFKAAKPKKCFVSKRAVLFVKSPNIG